MSSPTSTPEGAFAPFDFPAALLIEAVGAGYLRLGPHRLTGAVLISPWGARPWGGLDDSATPLALAGRIDVLLLGGGAELLVPPPAFREALDGAGIGIEPMPTRAAARAFNLLLGEGRRIALAALPL